MRDDRPIWKRKPLTAAAWVGACVLAWVVGIAALGWIGRGGLDPLLGSAQAAPRPPLPAVRVVDGDTLQIGGEVVRVSNMDAPETGSRAECWAEARLGVEAKAYLRHVTAADGLFDLSVTRTGKDRYGRTLALVSVNGEDVGERMVSAALAAPWTGRRWDWCGPMNMATEGAPVLARNLKRQAANQ